MFRKYAGLTMEERDVVAAEWLPDARDERPPAPDSRTLIFLASTRASRSVRDAAPNQGAEPARLCHRLLTSTSHAFASLA